MLGHVNEDMSGRKDLDWLRDCRESLWDYNNNVPLEVEEIASKCASGEIEFTPEAICWCMFKDVQS